MAVSKSCPFNHVISANSVISNTFLHSCILLPWSLCLACKPWQISTEKNSAKFHVEITFLSELLVVGYLLMTFILTILGSCWALGVFTSYNKLDNMIWVLIITLSELLWCHKRVLTKNLITSPLRTEFITMLRTRAQRLFLSVLWESFSALPEKRLGIHFFFHCQWC